MGNELNGYKLESENKFFKIYSGYEEKEKITLFYQEKEENYISNCIKHLKVLKHPNILKFKGNNNSNKLFKTEYVTPLPLVLQNLKEFEKNYGIYQILMVIEWIHSMGLLINTLNLNTIYVNSSYDWLLGEFQFCYSENELEKVKDCLKYIDIKTPNEMIIPPVVDKNRDYFCLEKIIMELFKDKNDWIEKVQTRNIPELIEILEKECLFIQMNQNLNQIKIKIDKENFFKNLKENIKEFDDEIIKKRIIPKVLNIEILLEPNSSHFLSSLFSPNEILGDKDFEEMIHPFIIQSFESNRHKGLRIILLNHLKSYIWSFSPHIVQSLILNEVIKTSNESDQELYESSLNSLVVLSIYFKKCDQIFQTDVGQLCINDTILKTISLHTIKNGNDKKRIHALLCLIKLWEFNKNIIKQVLKINLYSTELKSNTLNILILNHSIFNKLEIIHHLFPLILPLRLDENQIIREKTNMLMKKWFELLNKENPENMIDEIKDNINISQWMNLNVIQTNNFHGNLPKNYILN